MPHLSNTVPSNLTNDQRLEHILDSLFRLLSIDSYIFWYYTPMALGYTANFTPRVTVYDCMDELSAFKFAPPALVTEPILDLKIIQAV